VRRVYEVWHDPEAQSITLLDRQSVAEQRANGLLAPVAVLLYQVEAATPEEASAIHSLRMGWEPYRPVGAAAPCPQCGAMLYPEGSGVCWRGG
jgi:hypothetical protein